MTITHPHSQRKSISMTDQNDSSQYGMLRFPLSWLVFIEHSIELFVLALMQPREFLPSTALPSVLLLMLLPLWGCRIIYHVLFFILPFIIFKSKIYVNLIGIVCLLSKCSPNVLLCNSIRLVEKLLMVVCWTLMKLLTYLTCKQATDVCAHVCAQYEWTVKMKASLAMMRAASRQCSNGLRYGRGHLWILELSKACSTGRLTDHRVKQPNIIESRQNITI